MNHILRDMSGQDISDRYRQLIHETEHVTSRTDIIATSGSKKDDRSVVINDAYTTLSQEFGSILNEVSASYKDTSSGIVSQLHLLMKSFEHEITDKYTFSLSTSGRTFITQSFRDESSNRIYSYDGFMAICQLVLGCISVLTDKKSSTAQIDKLTAKCLLYSQDKMFDFTAGKTMGALGYTDTSSIQKIYNCYKEVLTSLTSPELRAVISTIHDNIVKLSGDKVSLDKTLATELSSGHDVSEHMGNYRQMLELSMYCKLINGLVVGSLVLTDRLDMTIKNVVDVASRYNVTTPTMNITEDMGGPLLPVVTEYRTVALECMLDRLTLVK